MSKLQAKMQNLGSTDLETLGYSVGACAFPSAGIGAPHIRDRLYWMANTSGTGIRAKGFGEAANQTPSASGEVRQQRLWVDAGASGAAICGMADAYNFQQRQGRRPASQSAAGYESRAEPSRCGIADGMELRSRPGPVNGMWADADWIFCRDGKWRPVEPGTQPLVDATPSRVGRLRAYGNAINAQAAQVFIQAAQGLIDASQN